MQKMQVYLSQKQNIFSQFFAAFFISALSFEHSQKKMTLISSVLSKLATSKDLVGKRSKSSQLKEYLDMRHGKRTKTLIQS